VYNPFIFGGGGKKAFRAGNDDEEEGEEEEEVTFVCGVPRRRIKDGSKQNSAKEVLSGMGRITGSEMPGQVCVCVCGGEPK